jgi:hypothetical protein
MSIVELSRKAVLADLASSRFRLGQATKRWRLLSEDFPIVMIAVSAIGCDGRPGEFAFRFELSGYPTAAPEVDLWDLSTGVRLAGQLRPQGSPRLQAAFKDWGDKTVYRPWDRKAGAHAGWAALHPDLAWRSDRDLAFILEDLHGLLTSNALAGAARASA